MRAPLSVIIPTLNAAHGLPECLTALIEGLQTGVIRELIVTDGGSMDATLDIAREAGAEIVVGVPSRGGQLIRGANVAKGDWLLFLHSDTVLATEWAQVVQEHLKSQTNSAYFKLEFDRTGFAPRIVAAWANLRSKWFRLPYGDQGLLISRADYDAAGGYPDIPLMEDVALVRTLDPPPMALSASAKTSAARYVKTGWIRRGLRNLWTLIRYLCGADPHALARSYRR